MSQKIITHGGRIKSASIGLDFIGLNKDPVEVDKRVNELRKKPPDELIQSFFPMKQDIRQMVRGVGLYRPILKTDQGMPGNFMPFSIDMAQKDTPTDYSITGEEGIAIAEMHLDHNPETVQQIQRYFRDFRLQEVFEMLKRDYVGADKRPEKGRGEFLFIRAAKTDKEVVIGSNVVEKVETEVAGVVEKISEYAAKLEADFGNKIGMAGEYGGDNLLYCQPDVFILKDGTVKVEKINCPDVGLFLSKIEDGGGSEIFGKVQKIVNKLGEKVLDRIAALGKTQITLLTRDEVLEENEDVLEHGEMALLRDMLTKRGIKVSCSSLRKVDDIPQDETVLLLNIDCQSPQAEKLLRRHVKREIECYPNPFVQIAAQKISGLKTSELSGANMEKFLEISGAQPKNDDATRDVVRRVQRYFDKCDIGSQIVHVDLGREVVPVMQNSLHSVRQIRNRIVATQQATGKRVDRLIFREIPADGKKLMIGSSTGPRLHSFRFMCVD